MSNALAVVLGSIALLSAVASAVAFFRANLATATIAALRGDRDDLQARTDRQSEGIAEFGVRIAKQDTRISTLERENVMLRGMASGTEAVDRLANTMAEHLQQMSAEHAGILTAINAVREEQHVEVVELIATIRGTV